MTTLDVLGNHTLLHQSVFQFHSARKPPTYSERGCVTLLTVPGTSVGETVLWEPNEVLQIPVNTRRATPKATLSTFSIFLLASFDAKGIFGKGIQHYLAFLALLAHPPQLLVLLRARVGLVGVCAVPCTTAAPSAGCEYVQVLLLALRRRRNNLYVLLSLSKGNFD